MSKDDKLELLTWKGKKLYRCRLCSFDSLDKKRFEQHFARAHPPLRVIDGGLESKTRDELNQVATKAGIQGVEGFSTKADVIAAIETVPKKKGRNNGNESD